MMKKVLIIFSVIFILIAPKSVYANTKEYFVDKLNIEAQILDNGDVVINEIIEYRFNGDFNGIYRNLNLDGANDYLVNGISIIDNSGNIINITEDYNDENNTYQINRDYNSAQIKIFSKSNNESKKFNLNYTIKGAAKKYTNYSQLYWNFYDVENIESVKEGTVKISLKDENFDINNLTYDIYGDGEIITNNTEQSIIINFKGLTTLIGINMKFQKDYLSMAEELAIDDNSEDYNLGYTDYYKEQGNDEGFGILAVFIFIGAGVGALIFALNKSKFNKEVNEYRSKYIFTNEEFIMEPPSDIPPGLVNLLIDEKNVSNNMLIATLFYLANKGNYTIEEINNKSSKKKNDLVFTRTDYNKNQEYSHLQYIIDWFEEYETNGKFSMKEIKNIVSSKRNANKFIKNLEKWISRVKEDGEKIGFYIKIKDKNVLENSWYNEKKRWISYKNYLNNIYKIDNINDDSLSDLTIIYALALEISENDLNEIVNLIIDKASFNIDSFNNLNYMYMNNYFFYIAMFNSITDKAYNTVNPPSSTIDNNSTTLFSGSDFSGGGGGGSGAF
ncbi:DUF2207 family protein [Clostridium tertium]|uniref:DUF2207 family protein n=1 Tax=Clostridium tertium TaxID=1559 RepID=UPI001AEAE135|nr:DUF2207 domain-containing protein [Clostridium tertium]MBP1867482.1 hypothetical protein [Clostridium tertium]